MRTPGRKRTVLTDVFSRHGIKESAWLARFARQDTERARMVRRARERSDLGGVVLIWSRTTGGVTSRTIIVQPGIADDLPSLLSSLAVETAWPEASAPDKALTKTEPARARAVGVWARVWQVREDADLRVIWFWDDQQQWRGRVELRDIKNAGTLIEDDAGLRASLERFARTPAASHSPHALLLAGNAAMQSADYTQAHEYYCAGLQHLPRHAEGRRNLALTLARLQRWEEAVEAMRAAGELLPDDPQFSREYLAMESNAGIFAVQHAQLDVAAGHFLHILQLWPEEPTALTNLANIRLREGRYSEARAIWLRFLRLHPGHAAVAQIRQALQALPAEPSER